MRFSLIKQVIKNVNDAMFNLIALSRNEYLIINKLGESTRFSILIGGF